MSIALLDTIVETGIIKIIKKIIESGRAKPNTKISMVIRELTIAILARTFMTLAWDCNFEISRL